MLVAEDFRAKARIILKDNWGVAVGTGFVATVLGAYTALGYNGGSISSNEETTQQTFESLASIFSYEVLMLFIAILGVIAIMAVVYSLIRLFLGGPITLGYVKFNMEMVNGRKPDFFDLFTQFDRFKDAFCMNFLRGLFIILWTFCLIIPGIVATFSYAMAPYIMYENPGMTATESIERSKKMMEGNRWRLFCLNISFIGWGFLCLLTFGIGFLWLKAYMEASYACFYDELKREQFVMSSDSEPVQEENGANPYNMY